MRIAPATQRRLTDALHLFVLSAFAIAQPLFELLSNTPAFFTARRSQPIDLVLLAVVLCAGVPSLLVLLEVAAGALSRRLAYVVHLSFVALLIAAIALPPLGRSTTLPTAFDLAIAAAIGIAAAAAYDRLPSARTFSTFLAPAPLVFAGLFLFASPVASIVRPPAALAGSAADRVSTSAPVVLVVFDELPLLSLLNEELEIDAARYPAFAAIASTSTWFRNGTAVADLTASSLPSILTGRYTTRKYAPTLAIYPENVFTLLAASHAVIATEPVTRLCPEDVCRDAGDRPALTARMTSLVWDAGVLFRQIAMTRSVRGRPAAATAVAAPADGGWSRWRYYWEEWLLRDRKAKFRRFVGAIAAGEERPFYFLHTVLPHRPYIYLPSGTSYRGERDGLDVPERWPDEPLAPVLAYQRHLLQVAFVDRLLGELVAQLRAADVYDRALLVVVADHGVSFRPGEVTRNVTDTNFDEQERVPLFVKLPGQRAGRVSDRNVELVDVLPTIAQTLGIAVPWRMDGHSMLDKQAPERPNKTVLAWSSGTMETFPGRFAPAAMRRAIAYRLSLFGSGGSPAELFGIGEARSLLGRSLADSGVTGAVPIAVELDRGPRGKIDALPCIRGKLLDAADARGALAVEIGGIVRAVTLPFTAKNGAIRLAAPIAESPSRAGAEVRVLRLPAELSPALSSPAPASPGDRAGADTDRHSRSRGRG